MYITVSLKLSLFLRMCIKIINILNPKKKKFGAYIVSNMVRYKIYAHLILIHLKKNQHINGNENENEKENTNRQIWVYYRFG